LPRFHCLLPPFFPDMQATRLLLRNTTKHLPKPLSRFQTSQFHSSAAVMVKAGDSIPNIDLYESNPGNKVNLSKELGSGLIIGVPAAFSKCPATPCLCCSFTQSQRWWESAEAVFAPLPSLLKLQSSGSNIPEPLLTHDQALHVPTPISRATSPTLSSKMLARYSLYP
jgi:hypothetical protein